MAQSINVIAGQSPANQDITQTHPMQSSRDMDELIARDPVAAYRFV